MLGGYAVGRKHAGAAGGEGGPQQLRAPPENTGRPLPQLQPSSAAFSVKVMEGARHQEGCLLALLSTRSCRSVG